MNPTPEQIVQEIDKRFHAAKVYLIEGGSKLRVDCQGWYGEVSTPPPGATDAAWSDAANEAAVRAVESMRYALEDIEAVAYTVVQDLEGGIHG